MRSTIERSALGFRRVIAVLVVALVVAILMGPTTTPAQAGTGDNYPWKFDTAFPSCGADNWGYCKRYCTSWVAWAVHDRNGFEMPRAIGNASGWGSWAQNHGYAVNMTPARGSVAWWGGGNHVAWVSSVNSNGTVTVEEYNNPAGSGKYNVRSIPKGSVSGYIHFKDLPGGSSSIANGDYIQVAGNPKVYRVAGGAPLHVYSWSGVGGAKPVKKVTQAQFDALPDYPKNGTVLRGATTGKVYIVAGRAPMYVSSWDAVGGTKPYTNVDQRAIDNLPDHPMNGTVLNSPTTGRVYIVAGGAPMYVSSWSSVGGVKPYTKVDQRAIDNLPDYPADGTILNGVTSGKVYVVAGHAPMYVSSWSAIGGTKPYTKVDQRAIEALPDYPTDGTVLNGTTSGSSDGRVFIVAGGAPMGVSSWAAVGGMKPYTTVDQQAIDRGLRGYPSDGTVVRGYVSQRIYRVSNQETFYVSDPSQVQGVPVIIDDWAITNQLQPTN